MTNAATVPQVIASIGVADAGIRINVIKNDAGYSVTLFDVDAAERLPYATIYKTKAEAIAKANEIAELSR